MKVTAFITIGIAWGLLFGFLLTCLDEGHAEASGKSQRNPGDLIRLPSPILKGTISIEETLQKRRSIRDYQDAPLTLSEISQILWAAQGITTESGKRTAPSGGATFPMEIYLAVRRVETLKEGLYHYEPQTGSIRMVKEGSLLGDMARVSLNQSFIAKSAASLVIAAQYERTTAKYKERGIRYVHMESGCISENIHLEAEALGLGTVIVGAFNDEALKKVLGISEEPLIIMPLGRKK